MEFAYVPKDPMVCAPLTLVAPGEDADAGWIGGGSPIGRPAGVPLGAAFFLTLRVDGDAQLSLFVEGDAIALRRRRGAVHAIVHEPCASIVGGADSLLQPLIGLKRGGLQEDWLRSEGGALEDPLPFSKMGGRPALEGALPSAQRDGEAFLSTGARLVLQLTMPGRWDYWPGGNWPLLDQVLWIFARPSTAGAPTFEWVFG